MTGHACRTRYLSPRQLTLPKPHPECCRYFTNKSYEGFRLPVCGVRIPLYPPGHSFCIQVFPAHSSPFCLSSLSLPHPPPPPPMSMYPFLPSFLQGMLIGAGFWSIHADKHGRRIAYVQSLACVFVGGVLSALSPNLVFLCVCRVLVGFGVGGE